LLGRNRLKAVVRDTEQLEVPNELREAADAEVYDTPHAVQRFRELLDQGIDVALLMHSTC
jgi:hypothetical protein